MREVLAHGAERFPSASYQRSPPDGYGGETASREDDVDDGFDVIAVGAGPGGEVCAGRLGENGLSVAIVGEVPLDRLCHAVPCFPTRSEVWLRLLETYGL